MLSLILDVQNAQDGFSKYLINIKVNYLKSGKFCGYNLEQSLNINFATDLTL